MSSNDAPIRRLHPGQQVRLTVDGTLLRQEADGVWSVELDVSAFPVVSVCESGLQPSREETRQISEPQRRSGLAALASGLSGGASKARSAAEFSYKKATFFAKGAAAAAEGATRMVSRLSFGASSSSEQQLQRRRLSLLHIPKDSSKCGVDEEGERGLVATLDEQCVAQLLGDVGGESAILSACGKSELAVPEDHVGFACRRGMKPEPPNQDAWCVVRVLDDFTVYGVFDGHGSHGHHVAQFVKENLPRLLIQDARFKKEHSGLTSVCIDSFEKMQDLIRQAGVRTLDARLSGCSATLVIHDFHRHQLTIAHVGDCTACLLRKPAGCSVSVHSLTRDHDPSLRDERARIEEAGGHVVFDGWASHRVMASEDRLPGLKLSRCLGNFLGHICGVSAVPEVSVRSLGGDDYALIIGSNGIWEFVPQLQAAELVTQAVPEHAMRSADTLVQHAWDCWTKEEGGMCTDDLTVVLAHFNAEQPLHVVRCKVQEMQSSSGNAVKVTCTSMERDEELAVMVTKLDAEVSWLREELAAKLNRNKNYLELVLGDRQDDARDLQDGELLSGETLHLSKVVIVGDSGVGKSSILLRFCDDEFDASKASTIGVDFKTKRVRSRDKHLKLALWDTAGQEMFGNLPSSYFQGSHAICLVYDYSDKGSFDQVKYWHQVARSKCSTKDAVVMLIANKVDLASQGQEVNHEVTHEEDAIQRSESWPIGCCPIQEGRDFALANSMLFSATSAKTNQGIEETFAELAFKIVDTL